MKNLILFLIAVYIMFNLLFMFFRVFIHSNQIRICMKKEAYIKPLPFTKCPVDAENEEYICFLADYHGQESGGTTTKSLVVLLLWNFLLNGQSLLPLLQGRGRKNENK